MSGPTEMSLHVLRARRTAASARALLAVCGLGVLAAHRSLAGHPALTAAGFAVILLTAIVQLARPRVNWLQLEEPLATVAGVLIVGLSDERVTVLSVLWLAALASGVLARGGRVHWLGRPLLLGALALPIARELRLTPEYAGLCIAALALLLTCGRLTRELNHLLVAARHDADHDGLTGALSRSEFRRVLDDLAARPDGQSALLVLDLDRFGQINKFHGHAAGDAVLAGVVRQARATLGPGSVLGRLGGDEFAAILPAGRARMLADLLLEELARGPGGVPGVRACAGLAPIARPGQDADTLLRTADIALRVSKRGGGPRVCAYEGRALGDEGPEGAQRALHRMIAGEDLTMVVQPIVEPRDARVHAYEALARFGPEGREGPLQWFALADELDLRLELELACLRAALNLLPRLPGHSRLSVNLSAPVLLDVRTQVLLEGRALDRLIIEITEDALVHAEEGLQAVARPLVARGALFAIDDMGAGYSGLRQILSLRPGYLKLDRSLVRGIDGDSDRAALVTALLGYARSTGSRLVAEGVECERELAALVRLGVSLVQGYVYARPALPWPAIAALSAGPESPTGAGPRPSSVNGAPADVARAAAALPA